MYKKILANAVNDLKKIVDNKVVRYVRYHVKDDGFYNKMIEKSLSQNNLTNFSCIKNEKLAGVGKLKNSFNVVYLAIFTAYNRDKELIWIFCTCESDIQIGSKGDGKWGPYHEALAPVTCVDKKHAEKIFNYWLMEQKRLGLSVYR